MLDFEKSKTYANLVRRGINIPITVSWRSRQGMSKSAVYLTRPLTMSELMPRFGLSFFRVKKCRQLPRA